jgi:hypothetical protein
MAATHRGEAVDPDLHKPRARVVPVGGATAVDNCREWIFVAPKLSVPTDRLDSGGPRPTPDRSKTRSALAPRLLIRISAARPAVSLSDAATFLAFMPLLPGP